MNSIWEVPKVDMRKVGVHEAALSCVWHARETTWGKLEDGGRSEHHGSGDRLAVGHMAPHADKMTKYKWGQLADTQDTGCVYLRYTQMQERAIGCGIPLMPFEVIVLRYEAVGLCMPGMGYSLYRICDRVLTQMLKKCMPADDSQKAESIRHTLAGQPNGFDTLWFILKVVTGILDPHRVPARPVYDRRLS